MIRIVAAPPVIVIPTERIAGGVLPARRYERSGALDFRHDGSR